MARKYTGIEIMRMVFVCLIPLLHISSFPYSVTLTIIRQYLSRLGVPFFFAISRMFLATAVNTQGRRVAWIKFEKRIVQLFALWVLIYLPLFICFKVTLQQMIFKTPAYLWYLSAVIFAAIPFCLIKPCRFKYLIAFSLYVLGTVLGGYI